MKTTLIKAVVIAALGGFLFGFDTIVISGTTHWLQSVFVNRFPDILKVQFIDLCYNDKMATLFCRLRYLVDPNPIPTTLEKQAEYYKRIYNTRFGKATPEQYIKNYKKI